MTCQWKFMGSDTEFSQWEFQDPKMELLSLTRPYFVGIFPCIGLLYGRYRQFAFLKQPFTVCLPATFLSQGGSWSRNILQTLTPKHASLSLGSAADQLHYRWLYPICSMVHQVVQLDEGATLCTIAAVPVDVVSVGLQTPITIIAIWVP